MSEFSKYTLSPGAVASMTEPTTDLQRNYRQRGMLDHYGELQENGRWKYSLFDLVAIWICDHLSERGKVMERRDGFRFGHMLAGHAVRTFIQVRHARDGDPGFNPLFAQYAVFVHEGNKGDGQVLESSMFSGNFLRDLADHEFAYAQIIDVEYLAKNIPTEICGLLLSADENDKETASLDDEAEFG